MQGPIRTIAGLPSLTAVTPLSRPGRDGAIAEMRRATARARQELQKARTANTRQTEILQQFIERMPVQFREQIRGAGLSSIETMDDKAFGGFMTRLAMILDVAKRDLG